MADAQLLRDIRAIGDDAWEDATDVKELMEALANNTSPPTLDFRFKLQKMGSPPPSEYPY
jgi:hypothetical protein